MVQLNIEEQKSSRSLLFSLFMVSLAIFAPLFVALGMTVSSPPAEKLLNQTHLPAFQYHQSKKYVSIRTSDELNATRLAGHKGSRALANRKPAVRIY